MDGLFPAAIMTSDRGRIRAPGPLMDAATTEPGGGFAYASAAQCIHFRARLGLLLS